MALKEGSGYFFVNTSVTGIVDVVFQDAQRTVEVRSNICVCDGIMMLNNMLCAFQEISMPNLMQRSEFFGNENIHFDLLWLPRFLLSTQGR